VAAHPAATSLAELSTDQTRITVTVETAVPTAAATSSTAVVASSTMDLTRATTAAAAAASSAASQVDASVATSRTVALVATAIHQEEAPAVPTMALHHQARTSPRDSPTTANLVKATVLTLALTLVQHRRALHRSLAPTTRLAETLHTDNSLTVDSHKVGMEDTSSQVPMVVLLSSMVAMTKAVTAVLVVLVAQVVMGSRREATASPKADTVDSSLLTAAMEVVDTSSSTPTAVTEDDLCRALFGYRNVTWCLRWRKLDDCT